MTDSFDKKTPQLDTSVFHLPKRRGERSERETIVEDLELSIAGHFREQNDILRTSNKELQERLARITNSVEHLAREMHGFRTGKTDQAFARICGPDGNPDLPTVRGEAAFWYPHTSASIGLELGFHSSQIGLLLGPRGLDWVGNGDYQEIGRAAGKGHSKFWHVEVPRKLASILHENLPAKHGISDKLVLSIFRRWKERHALAAANGRATNITTSH